MSHIPDSEIAQCMRETGMARVQAFYHCRQRHHLQEMAKREQRAAAQRAALRYALQNAKEQA